MEFLKSFSILEKVWNFRKTTVSTVSIFLKLRSPPKIEQVWAMSPVTSSQISGKWRSVWMPHIHAWASNFFFTDITKSNILTCYWKFEVIFWRNHDLIFWKFENQCASSLSRAAAQLRGNNGYRTFDVAWNFVLLPYRHFSPWILRFKNFFGRCHAFSIICCCRKVITEYE
jgi:hypothetical protein